MKIFCKLGFHKWSFYHDFYPHKNARPIIKWIFTAICSRCKKITKETYNFDPETGQPIN